MAKRLRAISKVKIPFTFTFTSQYICIKNDGDLKNKGGKDNNNNHHNKNHLISLDALLFTFFLSLGDDGALVRIQGGVRGGSGVVVVHR